MTPISEMTNEQLDRWIAEKKGWSHIPNGHWKWVYYYEDEESEGDYRYDPPSFTTDARYAFELLEEMAKDNPYTMKIEYNPATNSWTILAQTSKDKWIPDAFSSLRLTRAICEAWAQWRGGE